MNTPLRNFIAKRKFEALRTGRAEFATAELICASHHSDLDGASSIYIRLECNKRLVDLTAWESGLCDIHRIDLESDDQVEWHHFSLSSETEYEEIIIHALNYVLKQ